MRTCHGLFSILCLGAALAAQHPNTDLVPGSQPAPIGGPDANNACGVALPSVDLTQILYGDQLVLGCAYAWNLRKWFFAGGNSVGGNKGTPRIYVVDADADDMPAAAARWFTVAGAPTSSFGARDLGYDSTTMRIYHGDENGCVWEIDALSETYTGRTFRFHGSAITTLRGIAVRPSIGDTLRVLIADVQQQVEVWDIDQVSGLVLPGPVETYPNPNSAYGLSFDHRGGNVLAFGQSPMPCPGSGMHRATLIDSQTGRPLRHRGGDPSVAGQSAYPNGGYAAGCETAPIGGQWLMAAVQQGDPDDALAFVPILGYAAVEPTGCGSRLAPVNNPDVGARDFGLRVHSGPPGGFTGVFLNVGPPSPIRIGVCTLSVQLSGAVGLSLPLDLQGGAELRLPIPNSPALDGAFFVVDTIDTVMPPNGLWTSSNSLELFLAHLDPQEGWDSFTECRSVLIGVGDTGIDGPDEVEIGVEATFSATVYTTCRDCRKGICTESVAYAWSYTPDGRGLVTPKSGRDKSSWTAEGEREGEVTVQVDVTVTCKEKDGKCKKSVKSETFKKTVSVIKKKK